MKDPTFYIVQKIGNIFAKIMLPFPARSFVGIVTNYVRLNGMLNNKTESEL